jgi:hypothetical protein
MDPEETPMRAFRSATIGAVVVTLAAAGTVALAAPATAAPCGNQGGTGSSLIPGFGSSDLGSSSESGSSGSGNVDAGPQGPLPTIVGGNTRAVSWVTGPRSENRTLDRFGISGTDLGISWDNGSGQTLMAFGDTFGDCGAGGQEWRHNVLLRSDDTQLDNGITVHDARPGDTDSGSVVTADRPQFSRQIIDALDLPAVEITTIPTAAISIKGVQYINYMSVRAWGDPGRWDTNYSAIAVSRDNGQIWAPELGTVRVNSDVTIDGVEQVHADNSKFQMNAYLRGPDDYIYQYGTLNGRYGAVYLARVKAADILDLTKYQYYSNNAAHRWSANMGDLKTLVGAPVSEMSVAWNEHLQKYVMLHGIETQGRLVIRTADHPEGPWSNATTLLNLLQTTGGIYAPYIYPASSGRYLYFTASRWSDYNVMLLRTDLDHL